jgi:hypothetical protein
MNQKRVGQISRTLAGRRSRRGVLGASAAFVALLAAKPVAAEKAAKPNAPHQAPKHPGKGQPGNSQPGGGQLGSPGPSCEDQCIDASEQCQLLCPRDHCICRSPECMCDERLAACLDRCPPA